MTSQTCRTAANAIDRSISHNEIVTLPYDADIASDLLVECEDSTESHDVTEYWGTTEHGDTWRVHMSMSQRERGE